jgi:hypothetical protein
MLMVATKIVISIVLVTVPGAIVWFFVGMWIRDKWPAEIPENLAFNHIVKSNNSLREIAEYLAKIFVENPYPEIVCLGAVRGNAARVLFHVGHKNSKKHKNIYRDDYLLCVVRVKKSVVKLVITTKKPYRYFRLKHDEAYKLNNAVISVLGQIEYIDIKKSA